jgi:exodeoxyribonuclease VII large subunit
MALDHSAARLHALSPRATLARGYAIVRSGGVALRDAAATHPGSPLEIELSTGGLTATVAEVRP